MRDFAAAKLGVQSTPTFFVDGVRARRRAQRSRTSTDRRFASAIEPVSHRNFAAAGLIAAALYGRLSRYVSRIRTPRGGLEPMAARGFADNPPDGRAKGRAMKFDRLRLAGFKSFCDPDRVQDRARPDRRRRAQRLRQVESRRGAALGDGRNARTRACAPRGWTTSSSPAPARGRRATSPRSASSLDNSDRRAPAAFNDSETIEVTRRIERDAGSTYRVNGREVRARDVQLLFADASTGARSPALVRQGQIGEIIAAKPQARRLHPRGGGRRLRPALAPPRGRAQAQGGRGQSPAGRGRAQADRRADRQPEAPGAPGEPLPQSGRRHPPPRGAGAADRLARAREPVRRGATQARRGPARSRRAHPRAGRGGAPAGDRRRRPAAAARRGGAPRRRAAPADAGARRARAEEKRASERRRELERRIAECAATSSAKRR